MVNIFFTSKSQKLREVLFLFKETKTLCHQEIIYIFVIDYYKEFETMTVLEFQAKKAELAKRILCSDDESIINKLSNFYNSITETYPCDYTEKEVAKACEEAIRQYKEGRITPHSEMKRKIS